MTIEEKRKVICDLCEQHHDSCLKCPIRVTCETFGVLFNNAADEVVEALYAAVPKEYRTDDQTAKSDSGKPVYSLVPPAALDAIERVRSYGNAKYPEGGIDNWRKVEAQRYWEATLRHARAAWYDFRAKDDESGLMHIEHMMCNLAFIMQFIEEADNG